jgi:tRNA dimethylallyltransferase
MKKTLLVIGGPTAVGKTACGIEVAQHFGSEIISADSRQIYRECTIGTAVPTPEELAAVPHHFIQTVSLSDPYNASRFEEEVLQKLRDLFETKDLVLMVGGSGLYIDAVCHGIDELPSADLALRKELHRRFEMEGLDPLTEELKRLDPLSHARIDLKNHMRVMKALEVSIQTGIPYSSFLTALPKERPFRILRVAMDMERDLLYQRINARVERMMERGLLDEVQSLQAFRGSTPMKTVGYRELFRYFDGELNLDEAVDLIKRNSRKFARKQITWFRKKNQYRWITSEYSRRVISWVETLLGARRDA